MLVASKLVEYRKNLADGQNFPGKSGFYRLIAPENNRVSKENNKPARR
jgi:hypothetical protein